MCDNYKMFWHQHSKDVTNIEIKSPTSINRHQLEGTNITVSDSLSSCQIDVDDGFEDSYVGDKFYSRY